MTANLIIQLFKSIDDNNIDQVKNILKKELM